MLELTPCLRLINCQVRDKFPMLEEFSECTPKSALFLVKVSVARAQCRSPIFFWGKIAWLQIPDSYADVALCSCVVCDSSGWT